MTTSPSVTVSQMVEVITVQQVMTYIMSINPTMAMFLVLPDAEPQPPGLG